jgi:hypothetical protein
VSGRGPRRPRDYDAPRPDLGRAPSAPPESSPTRVAMAPAVTDTLAPDQGPVRRRRRRGSRGRGRRGGGSGRPILENNAEAGVRPAPLLAPEPRDAAPPEGP